MPTNKSPTQSNAISKQLAVKLSTAEKKLKIKRSREKARMWAEQKKMNNNGTISPVNQMEVDSMKKRKAAVSPPSSPELESIPENIMASRRIGRKVVEMSPDNYARRDRDDDNRERKHDQKVLDKDVANHVGKSVKKSSRVRKKVRQSSPVPPPLHDEQYDYNDDVQQIQEPVLVDSKSRNETSKVVPIASRPSSIVNPYTSAIGGSISKIKSKRGTTRSAFSSPIERIVPNVPKEKSLSMTPTKKSSHSHKLQKKSRELAPIDPNKYNINSGNRLNVQQETCSSQNMTQEHDDRTLPRQKQKITLTIKVIVGGIFICALLFILIAGDVDLHISTIMSNNKHFQCFESNMIQKEAENIYEGKMPMIEVDGNLKFVPLELQTKGISECSSNFIPCPDFGRCFRGFLVDCHTPELAKLGFTKALLEVNHERNFCELSPFGREIIQEVHYVLETSASHDICSRKRRGLSLFGSLGKDSPDPVSFSNIAKSIASKYSTDNGEKSFNDQIVQELLTFLDQDVIQINTIEKSAELTPSFLATKLSLPVACWVQLFLRQLLFSCWSIFITFTYSVTKYYASVLFSQPLNCLLLTIFLWLLSYLAKQRRKRSRTRKEVAEMRELAYDMLVSVEDSYAVTHLRDTITHRMFPVLLKDRNIAAKTLWPKVVKEVNHDSRIRKIEKNVDGFKTLHWEWISVPARKERRSMMFSPSISSRESTSDLASPSLKDLKRNLL